MTIIPSVAQRLPFAGVDFRIACLRAILLGATLLGLLASFPVWSNARLYPLLPIAAWFPILPSPGDKILYVSMLLALLLACWRYRPAVIFFLCASLLAFFQDQNRGQPWLYMYWVMLWLTLFSATQVLAACRIAMSAVYVWSGVQKLNERFFQVAPDWFAGPLADWPLPAFAGDLMRWAVLASPFVEIGIGLGVWHALLRPWALGIAATLHVLALLVLGPLGYNYNWVVWPWNLAMVALMFTLFSRGKFWRDRDTDEKAATKSPLQPAVQKAKSARAADEKRSRENAIGLPAALAALRQSKPAFILVTLYALLPILSFFGRWDSDFSFSLYSENQAAANVFVSKNFGDNLPEPLRRYFKPFPQAFDPQRQNAYAFAFQQWCYEELRVPPIPEPRAFRAMYNFLRQYADRPEDLRMIVGTRGGPVIFFEGDTVELLERQ